MTDSRPNDRTLGTRLPASPTGEPVVYEIERAGFGWNLSRRDLLTALLAAVACGRRAEGQVAVCGLAYAHGSSVTAIIVGFDGQSLITASLDSSLKFWSITTGGYYKTIALPGPATALTATSDGRLLTASSSENMIRTWSTGGVSGGTLEGHTGPVRVMATTPDGRILASAGEDQTIRLWSLPSLKYLRTLSGHTGTVRSLSISPDSEVLVSGSEDGTIRIWSLPEGRSMFSFAAHAGGVFSVAISADGRVMSSGGADQTVKLWSMPDGKLLATLTGHAAPVQTVAFKGPILVSGSTDGTIRQWSVSSRTAYGNPVSTGDTLTFLMITPDGQFIFTSGTDSSGKASLKWWQALDVIAFLLCLIDLAINAASVSGRQYSLGGIDYTLPCGSPMPAGATCKCDCVPGGSCSAVCTCVQTGCTCVQTGCSCVQTSCSCVQTGCSCVQVCTCHQVCYCVPVCTCNPTGGFVA